MASICLNLSLSLSPSISNVCLVSVAPVGHWACPQSYELETHAEAQHGDVCRTKGDAAKHPSAMLHVCPRCCHLVPGGVAPFCSTTEDVTSPCRFVTTKCNNNHNNQQQRVFHSASRTELAKGNLHVRKSVPTRTSKIVGGGRPAPVVCADGYALERPSPKSTVCRAIDNSGAWLCPIGWDRLSTHPYCIHTAPLTFDEACHGGGGEGDTSSSRVPTVSAFIRTWHGDVQWLSYLLRSVCKFGGGIITSVVVAFPEEDTKLFVALLSTTFPWAIPAPTNNTGLFEKAILAYPVPPEVTAHRIKHYNGEDDASKIISTGLIHGWFKSCLPGYAAQIYDKLAADLYVPPEAEYVMHLDSDVILSRPLQVEDVFLPDTASGKLLPRIERALWPTKDTNPSLVDERLGMSMQQYLWQNGTADTLRVPNTDELVAYDYMRRIGNVYPTRMYGELRAEIEKLHGVESAVLWFTYRASTYLGFPASEFQVLGAYAWKYERNAFAWNTCAAVDAGCTLYFPLHQSWSWGGLDEGTRAVYECILSIANRDKCLGLLSIKEFKTEKKED